MSTIQTSPIKVPTESLQVITKPDRYSIHGISPRVWLIAPSLLPVVVGNNGLTSVAIGSLLMSRGVEDLYFCTNSKDPYYKLLFSYGVIVLSSGAINYGLSMISQENPNSKIIRRTGELWRCTFGVLGIVAGSFFILDGALSLYPTLNSSNNALFNIITKRNYLDHKTIDHESLKFLSNICLHLFQDFKILSGSALVLASIQDVSRKLKLHFLNCCFDDAVAKVKRFQRFLFHNDIYFGAIVCLFGLGTTIDGWRRLLDSNNGIYDIIKNVEIAAGGTAIYYGTQIVMDVTNKDFHGSKDFPLASSYLGITASLLKYLLIDVKTNNATFSQPASLNNLVNSLLVMSLGYHGVHNLLKVTMKPFGHSGDEVTKKFTKHTAKGVWAAIGILSTAVGAHHAYDCYANLPITSSNVVRSSLTCAASLFCYYSTLDFLLGTKPKPKHFVQKMSGAVITSSVISGLVYFLIKK
ncbi:hypothetical protein AKO1_004766 [Acrasis kona]|uniref:Uncharacterized protein n=1 Tax=Acrasis kona TaxID=1008807 RepID=A0AAW2Z6C3_9EUKA